MTLTAGVISLVSSTGSTANLSATAATGGTSPYTYQWYRSTTSGFTPGGGNILSGATALALADTGLVPNTPYYYKVVATDTGHSNDTIEYAQLAVVTAQQDQNQFAQAMNVGVIDLTVGPSNLISVEIDASETGTAYPGSAVKMYDSAGGVPKVVLCTAASDEVLGFVAFNMKDRSYVAGDRCEIALAGTVMYLAAFAAIARGVQVELHVPEVGCVRTKTGSSGADIVGWAVDKASAAGDIIRVSVSTPSFAKA